MNIISRLFGAPRAHALVDIREPEWKLAPPRQVYQLLERYYDQNDLYTMVENELRLRGQWMPAMQPLRNPAHRVVEFYVAKLWPGPLPDALPIETENENIIPAIHQLWTWSNWGARKQVAARWLAIYGDLFIKVVARADRKRVYFQLIKPEYVTDFEVDERDYLTMCRIDTPTEDERGELVWHTEVWEKGERENDPGTYRQWTRERGGPEVEIDKLGTPDRQVPLSQFGIDFVPIVHIKLRDVGDLRGRGAFFHALDKVDEANRMATRLHQMLFRYNKPTWVLAATGTDGDKRPLPPPVIDGVSPSGTADVADDDLLRLPGQTTLTSLVPDLNYADALKILQDHMLELEKDLPELAYYRIREMNQVSGVAVRTMLSDAIDRIQEARGVAESGLARADAMGLTIGAYLQLFPNLGGTYEDGAFDHTFAQRDVIPLTATEEAQASLQTVNRLIAMLELGLSRREALRELGYTDAQIEQMADERREEGEDIGTTVLRGFDAGVSGGEEL